MEERVYEYIKKWKSHKNVVGILVSGSYATKLHTQNSDIDLRIIFSDDVETHYKGVETIDGYSYSYITGTITDYLRSIHNQFYRQSKFEARIFSLGVLLYDKNGAVEKLKEKAIAVMELDFETPASELFALKKYMLSNHFNHFVKTNSETSLRKYHYFQFLDHIFKAYSFYIGFEIPTIEKLDRILFDETYYNKNNFTAFSDKTFFKLWENAVNIEEKYFTETVKKLYEYVEERWGKFDANNFEAMI